MRRKGGKLGEKASFEMTSSPVDSFAEGREKEGVAGRITASGKVEAFDPRE